jgi:undecaprenyl-diphosphatase
MSAILLGALQKLRYEARCGVMLLSRSLATFLIHQRNPDQFALMLHPPYLRLVPICLCAIALLWGVFELAGAFAANSGKDLDRQLVLLLRDPDDPERMIGPPALEEAMRDFTALGGYAVLIMTAACFAVFARFELGRCTFHFFWLTVCGGYLFSLAMKQVIQRDRPSIVPHLSHVSGSTSFPSAHAMMSVIVFLTIGHLLIPLAANKHLRHLMLILPLWLATLVGISRVCMGVHYPTDVLGGWFGGLAWSWMAFLIRGHLMTRVPETKTS